MMSWLFVALQFVLPKHWLTRLVWRIARIRSKPIKNWLIDGFVRLYDVDLDEVPKDVPGGYDTFNDFFTRELDAGARPISSRADAIISPVDGTVSAADDLRANSIIQAKGIAYSLDELFAIDLEEARAFRDGSFATIYLAPYNYHRVHMPVDGELLSAHYVPGELFSVNDATVRRVRGLFRRNERLNLLFRTEHGPAALIFVGALNVGSISTPWTGEIRPRSKGVVETCSLGDANRNLRKGDLLGWFNMGSTVILLLPEGVSGWESSLVPGSTVRMGEAIGTISGS